MRIGIYFFQVAWGVTPTVNDRILQIGKSTTNSKTINIVGDYLSQKVHCRYSFYLLLPVFFCPMWGTLSFLNGNIFWYMFK